MVSLRRRRSYACKEVTYCCTLIRHVIAAALYFLLGLVVQRLDSAIHRINHYPVDKY